MPVDTVINNAENDNEEKFLYLEFSDFENTDFFIMNHCSLLINDIMTESPACVIQGQINEASNVEIRFEGIHTLNVGSQLFFAMDSTKIVNCIGHTMKCINFSFNNLPLAIACEGSTGGPDQNNIL